MTTDIVERLRAMVGRLRRTPAPIADVAPLLQASADEIERLRADGPMMLRGHDDTGAEWMGTMRQVMDDYRMAAKAEAGEAERLRAEVEALRNAADYARNKIMLGSIQGRKSDRDEHLREAYNTLYPALEEHTNGR